MDKIFIGIGSNLDDPLSQLKTGIDNITKLKMLEFIQVSHFYSSPPMGPQDQPDYINAVIEVMTDLAAEKLLDELQKIENKQGRERLQRWGARTLDLDILLFGKDVINTERLTVPHRGISDRNFVLYPLSDLLDSEFEVPTRGKISELLATCPKAELRQLSDI